MTSPDASYLSSLKGAQALLSMDPNLLRFPEVVLERIQIKIEDKPAEEPSAFPSAEEEEESYKEEELKGEEAWPDNNQETQKKDEDPFLTRADTARGGVVKRKVGRPRKNHGAESVRPGHRLAYNGSPGEVERSGMLRRGGKKRRGGWHHFLHRERQQLQRRQKQQEEACVEEERQRGQRFSEEENEALVAGVLDYYRELCGKSAMKGSATQKRRLWQEVTNRVNRVASTYRTIEVCKKRYADCRRAVKLKMMALEQQAWGRGKHREPIRFNNWEEQLHLKYASIMMAGAVPRRGQGVLDTCEPASIESHDADPAETSSPSWTPTIDTAACMIPAEVLGEAFSEGEEATSPLDVHVVSEWSEEEATPGIQQERVEALQEVKPVVGEGGPYVTVPEAAFMEPHYRQFQEEHRRTLRHLSHAHSAELHKLRENMVEGNARVVQQLECLTSEVREMNAHVRQIHMNQSHFNLMFQNYLSDTKQFYGAMVQAVRNLQQGPSVSPIHSPGLSPAQSPKPQPVPTPSNPLLQTPPSDFITVSPAGSAEPASASSTGSEMPAYNTNHYRRNSHLPKNP